MASDPSASFDFVFAGFGASACLLTLELDRSQWLIGKRILILEPDSKTSNDRTFCFWATEDSEIVRSLQPLISHRWPFADLNGRKQNIAPSVYHHIRGIDLYEHTRRVLSQYDVVWQNTRVSNIVADGNVVVCQTESGDRRGLHCFDSRPLPAWSPELPNVALIQSFYGWKIRLLDQETDSNTAVLMDFDVEQDGATQFVYRLPFASNEVLVELTRFGSDTVTRDRAEAILRHYITTRFGRFDVLETEEGRIPMEIGRNSLVPAGENHIILGSRAGMVKPSTGYAFRNMFDSATQVVTDLNGKQRKPKSGSARFRFYDHLLLLILKLWPWQGRPIFSRLLSGVAAFDILKFLDERSTMADEIRIFSKLPIPVFIRAVLVREYLMWKRYGTELIVLAGSALLLLGFMNWPTVSSVTAYGILIVGLVAVGIPHGALDDMLKYPGVARKIRLSFIVIYLLQGFAMLLVWWFNPLAGLIVFLLYSAWHFGQADLEESSAAAGRSVRMLLLGFFQGVSLLGIILLSHISELNAILSELYIAPLDEKAAGIVWYVFAVSVLAVLIRGDRQNLIGLLTLAVATQLPLLVAFGIYFVFQHSLRGWKHIRQRMQLGHTQLFRLALPFHLAAWALLALLYAVDPVSFGIQQGFGKIGLFFVFLSSLSFPHVLAMHRFYAGSRVLIR